MLRKMLRAPAEPHAHHAEVVDENPRQVIGAFFLALALYLGVAFGALAQEKITLDATQAPAAAETTTEIDVADIG